MIDDFENHCWKDIITDEIIEIYRPYRRETHIGERPALLVIDLYNMVFEGGPLPVQQIVREFPSSCGIYAHNAIKPIQELLALARSHELPIIYVTTETRKECSPSGLWATKRQTAEIVKPDCEIYQLFKPAPNDIIIYKARASAFYGTPLISHLFRSKIQSLIVCGESTSGCVRATVVDAYSNGIHTVLVEECCFDRSLLSHKINLFDIHHKYADVMHLEQVKKHFNGV